MFPRWTNTQTDTFTLQSTHQTAATSAIVHIRTQSPTPQGPPTVMETTLLRTCSVARTRLPNKTTTQSGPCAYTADRLQSSYMPGPSKWQNSLRNTVITLHQIDLDSPLHYGFYMEETRLNQRLRRVQCRCYCQTCDTQGNHLRIMHDFTATARRIAQEDVNAFWSGTRPTPGTSFHSRQRHRTSDWSLLSRIYSGLQVGMGSSASCLVLPVPCWPACWWYWRSQGQAGSSRQQPNMELLVPMSAGWTTSSTSSISCMATIAGGHSGRTSRVASRHKGLQGMAKQS